MDAEERKMFIEPVYLIIDQLKRLNANLEKNAYLAHNLNKLVTITDKLNWNLGVIAYPELKKKYPDVNREMAEERGREVENGNAEN